MPDNYCALIAKLLNAAEMQRVGGQLKSSQAKQPEEL